MEWNGNFMVFVVPCAVISTTNEGSESARYGTVIGGGVGALGSTSSQTL